MTTVTIEPQIRQLLSEIAHAPDVFDAPADATLDQVGIDSIGMIDLIYRLEESFGIRIPDEDVTPDNFESIASLTALVTRKCRS